MIHHNVPWSGSVLRPAARFLSVLLHPVLMPLLTVAMAMYVDPPLVYFIPPASRWTMLAMLGVMTIVFPVASTFLLMRAGVVQSVQMPSRQERIAPYLMTLIHFGLAYYLFRQAPVHPALLSILFGTLVATALTLVITFFWKISAHMVGIGGLAGALTALSILHGTPQLPFIAAVIVTGGSLGTARLLVSDHTQGQVVGGALLGWACVHATTLLGWWV